MASKKVCMDTKSFASDRQKHMQVTRVWQKWLFSYSNGLYNPHQISLLTLDNLIGPDANVNYVMEANGSGGISYNSSSFTTPHHLFCINTKVPLKAHVKVWFDSGDISVKVDTH